MPSVLHSTDRANHPPVAASSLASRRVRVLHIQSGRSYGGIQRMLVCLAECQAQCADLEHVFALCYHEQLSQELLARGTRVRDLGPARTRDPWGIWRANRRLGALLEAEAFDAVICHGSPLLAMFGFTIRRSGVPLVYWMHNDVKQRNKNFSEFVASRQRPSLVIANSEYTAASIPLHFARTPPHTVIACPVTQPTQRGLSQSERAKIRAELDTPQDAVVIALVGRPEEWKGHALLLEALARLRARPDWHCWIVGGAVNAGQAAFLETLRATAGRAGIGDRVHFLGQRSDISELLLAADLFCQPNLTPEPFGIVFIEALYAGLPAISIDHGGAKEIINDTCGRLVPPNEPKTLASTLEELVQDAALRATLGRAAPGRATAISDPANVLRRLHGELVAFKKTSLTRSTS